MKDLKNYSLKQHNTFGIDVRCKRFVEFAHEEEVVKFITGGELTEPFFVLGGGANILFTKDFNGTILPSAIKDVHRDGNLLRFGSGVEWDDVVAYSIDHGLYGAENLSIIPGEVGASAVQNIGAYGVEVKDLITTVEAIDLKTGEKVVFENSDCEYGYRQSKFKNEWKGRYFITYVTYKFEKEFRPKLEYGNILSYLESHGKKNPTAQELRNAIIEIRNSKLPDTKVLGNGGSFFINPIVGRAKYEELRTNYPDMPHYTIDEEHEKIPAGWLIEKCGWKGKSLGRAGVYEKQALVLVNRGGASGEEILNLCRAICDDVNKQFDIEIHPEVNII
jgi:UDP-N-acetylmuramate dehydrogenase